MANFQNYFSFTFAVISCFSLFQNKHFMLHNKLLTRDGNAQKQYKWYGRINDIIFHQIYRDYRGHAYKGRFDIYRRSNCLSLIYILFFTLIFIYYLWIYNGIQYKCYSFTKYRSNLFNWNQMQKILSCISKLLSSFYNLRWAIDNILVYHIYFQIIQQQQYSLVFVLFPFVRINSIHNTVLLHLGH